MWFYLDVFHLLLIIRSNCFSWQAALWDLVSGISFNHPITSIIILNGRIVLRYILTCLKVNMIFFLLIWFYLFIFHIAFSWLIFWLLIFGGKNLIAANAHASLLMTYETRSTLWLFILSLRWPVHFMVLLDTFFTWLNCFRNCIFFIIYGILLLVGVIVIFQSLVFLISLYWVFHFDWFYFDVSSVSLLTMV